MAANFDLDKLIAAEEKGDPYTFVFDGMTYELPPVMDVRAVAAIASGRLDDGLRILLGTEQWQQMQDSQQTFNMTMLEKLFENYSEFSGVGSVGKSSVSSISPRKAAKR